MDFNLYCVKQIYGFTYWYSKNLYIKQSYLQAEIYVNFLICLETFKSAGTFLSLKYLGLFFLPSSR